MQYTRLTHVVDIINSNMAAVAAEAKITEELRKELEKTEKACIRPIQVKKVSVWTLLYSCV